jgi:hypothetical protein
MNFSYYTSHNKLYHQSAEYIELITIYMRGNQYTYFILNGFYLWAVNSIPEKEPMHIFYAQPVLIIVHLNIIPLFGIIILIW